MERLDRFVDGALDLLGVSAERRERLAREKILYYYCRDEGEITRLTGCPSRGRYFVGLDAVVSTWRCHYHEILHLLMNYRLADLPLFTHPLLQEGFAVAYGGRGGKEPDILLDLGAFLSRSGMADVETFLDPARFRSADASMSYPVSGLYVRFLVEETGMDAFLDLYRAHSGENGSALPAIEKRLLPSREKWAAYLEKRAVEFRTILPAPGAPRFEKTLVDRPDLLLVDGEEWYYVESADTVLLERADPAGPAGRRFREILPGRPYKGERYLLIAGENEVSVYDLRTDNLTAKYVSAFSAPAEPIVRRRGRWSFLLRRNALSGMARGRQSNPNELY